MWIKLDDNALDHPKVLALSDGAFRLWMRGMAYCRKNLTDGLITPLAIKTFRESKPSRIAELTTAPEAGTAPLWEACDGGYRMHDYLNWNDSREHVQSMQWKARGRMAQKRSRDVRANITGTDSEVREQLRDPIPTQPNVYQPIEYPPPPKLEQTPLTPDSLAWFDRVYSAYPNKDRRKEAEVVWLDLHPSAELAASILTDVTRRVKAGWVKFERRFIPQLRNYLAGRMWEDVGEALPPYADEVDTRVPWGWQCTTCGEIHEGTAEQSKARLCLKAVAVNGAR